MYVYHKATFTLELSFSASTYDAKWMCFNFTHILMNIVGTIDLQNSLQIFSRRIVWQWKTVKGILVLCTMQGKKNVVHLQKRHQNEDECSTKQKHNIRSILLIKVLWTPGHAPPLQLGSGEGKHFRNIFAGWWWFWSKN